MWVALFKDLGVERVFDVSAGSGSAACGAAILGIGYEGLAMSKEHAMWLDNIMDKYIFAIIADDESNPEDKELRADVQANFATLIDEAHNYMTSASGNDDDKPKRIQDGFEDEDIDNEAETLGRVS